jgi:hypothetical protein
MRRIASISAPGSHPLRPAPRLGPGSACDELWLKDDTRNPSGSFKDRVVTMAISAAKALGIDTIACASTGNLAGAVSAHAAPPACPPTCSSPATSSGARSSGPGLRRQRRGRRRHLRRRQPAVRRGRRRPRLGLRQRQPAGLLRRGVEEHRLRDRRAARVEPARPRGDPDRVRLDADQDPQGLRRARRARAGRRPPRADLGRAGQRLLPGGRGLRPRTASTSGPRSPTRSPARWRSATPPTATTP